MAKKAAVSAVHVLPTLANESLYIGIDIGKAKHVAGFVSGSLLDRHERFEVCPALAFEQSREGFRTLVERIKTYVPLEQCFVLMEHTGHYHRPLMEYLLELDIPVYVMHVQKRMSGLLKSDKRDALGLANHLYNQLEKGVQLPDPKQAAHRIAPPTEAAALLHGLVRHRYELVRESTQRRNKLTAICDELFPEFTRVFRDANSPTALRYRDRFPTPQAVATATMSALLGTRLPHSPHPSPRQAEELQALAAQSIGTKNLGRQRALIFEQSQLIAELNLIRQHLDAIDAEAEQIIQHAREGRILLSMPGVGASQAATLIAAIGNVANFPSAAALKSYFGWAPQQQSSGKSLDSVSQSRGGLRVAKNAIFMVAMRALEEKSEWNDLYQRLVPVKCAYDERKQVYRGKLKVLGRVVGQIIVMMWALLKADQELLERCPNHPPEPMLYDRAVHHSHRKGSYKPLRPRDLPGNVIRMPGTTA